MKKLLKVLLIIFIIGLLIGCCYLFYQTLSLKSDKSALLKENSTLQQSIQAIGELTTVYTVRAVVKPGAKIKMDDLVEKKTPVSSVTDNFVTDPNTVIGKFYKVRIEPGTDLTNDLVMEEIFDEPVYERDVYFGFTPIGLSAGDYIDINVVLPDSEKFIGLEHKRIYMLLGNVAKIKMTEGELQIYESILYDKKLNGNVGFKVFASKYIEPGLDTSTIAFYPVRKSAESIVNINPNIKNKTRLINTALRDNIDQRLSYYRDSINAVNYPSPTGDEENALNQAQKTFIDTFVDDNGNIQTVDLSDGKVRSKSSSEAADLEKSVNTGKTNSSSDVNTSEVKQESSASEESSSSDSGNVDFNKTVNDSADSIKDNMNTIAETMAPVDSAGNQSNVTDHQKVNSGGGNLFDQEQDIE